MTRHEFFQRILPSGLIELRAIDLRAGVAGRKFTTDMDEIDVFCLEHTGREVYFGVAPRLKKSGGPRNHAPTCILWADIDFKETPEADARERLLLMDMPPHIVVNSGGGLHCYWVLDSPVEDAKSALRALAVSVGGDARSAEPAHILRVPDTLNHKYVPARRVYIEESRAGAHAWPHIDSTPSHATTTYTGPTGSAAALSKARAFMADRAPAVEGSGGDKWTFETACALVRDHGLSEADSLELLMAWNERCSPPWTSDELLAKIRGAARYGTGEVGSEDPARDFAGLGAEVLAPEGTMAKLDRVYKVVNDAGELRVYHRVRDDILNRYMWIKYKRHSFLEVCKSQLMLPMVLTGENKNGSDKWMAAGEYWIDAWRKKSTYGGVTFAPEHGDERTPDGRLNLWRGFALEEKRGSWEYLKEMTWESLCAQDQESYDYVVRWLARAVQRPWEPGETALVFKGPKGTGKSTLGRALVRLFGQHGMHISSKAQLTGRFNSHLRDVVALFADEAFWAGDKDGEGVLKSLITERSVAYEGKGRDVETGRNCVHLVMASNEQWVVPAGMDGERRFAVFEVATAAGMGRAYWDALHAELDNGGLEAMLYDLRRVDISGFNPQAVPQTDALINQKTRTMDPITAWLYEAAENGLEDLLVVPSWGEDYGDKGPGHYVAEYTHASYLRHCDRHAVRAQRASSSVLGIALARLVPTVQKKRILVSRDRQKSFYVLPSASEVLLLLDEASGRRNIQATEQQSDADLA